jgi:hypothetical protein
MPAAIEFEYEITENGCFIPTSHKLTPNGYFSMRVTRNGKTTKEYYHRVAYRDHYGEDSIPEGWEIDHVCRNRACFNWRHLWAMPAREHRYITSKFKYDDLKEEARIYWEMFKGDLTGKQLGDAVGISPGRANRWMREWRTGEPAPFVSRRLERKEQARQHWESTGQTLGCKALADLFDVEPCSTSRWITDWRAAA